MSNQAKFTALSSSDHASSGLDRAAFDVYDKPERHLVNPLQQALSGSSPETSGSESEQDGSAAKPRGLAKIRRVSEKVRSRTKAKADKIFHPYSTSNTSHQTLRAPALAPAPSNVDDDDRLFHPVPKHKGPQVKDILHHPVDTVQSLLHGASGAKVADTMDNQVISHGADVNMVRMYDKVSAAENEKDKTAALDDLEDLKKARQDTYVRWTMDRHVLKVRRIPPFDLPKPRKKDYVAMNEDGKNGTRWLEYGQDLSRFYARQYGDQYIDESPSLPPASEDALNTSFERLLMTSMQYQVLLMKVRHIYRWDDPLETAIFLGAYIFLWLIGHLAGAAVLGVIWLVIRRHLYPPTTEDLRENIKRSEDLEQTATNLTQLIEQHGSRGWVDALIKDLGPRSLLQVEDAADALEIMRNCYEWRSPRRTMLTLSLLALCWLYVTVVPLWVMIKSMQFSAGVMFFVLFPISSRYPHYRIVVSPLTWLFWKIPTDAEWAIARLRVEARHSKDALSRNQDMGDQPSTSNTTIVSPISEKSSANAIDIGKYHGTSQNHHGDLYVTSEGVRYVTAVRSNVLWRLQYEEVKTIQKSKSGDGLLFALMDGTERSIMGLKARNEIFTQILGYSELVWQVTG